MRVRLLITTAALALALAGCGGQSPTPAPYKPSKAATSASASSSTGSRPTVADGITDETAKATVKYYFVAMSNASNSGDTADLRQLGDPHCDSCTQVADGIDKLAAAGGTTSGADYRAYDLSVRRTKDGVTVSTKVRSGRQLVSTASAAPTRAAPAFNDFATFELKAEGSHWVIKEWKRT